MDRFGLYLVGTIHAAINGAASDVLPGQYPLAWISHTDYVLITIGAAALAARRSKWLSHWQPQFAMADAIVLIAFTVTGCDVAARQKVSIAINVNGAAGSRLRDTHAGRTLRVAVRDG
jgi:uncharacterized membrane protein YeiH